MNVLQLLGLGNQMADPRARGTSFTKDGVYYHYAPGVTPPPTPTPKPKPDIAGLLSKLLGSTNITFDNGGKVLGSNTQPIPTPTPTPAPTPSPTPMPASPENFEDLVKIMAQKAIERGFHPAVPVSQLALESGRNTSNINNIKNNNLGLGAYTSNPNKALSFPNKEAAMDYYFNMIANEPRYATAYAQRATPSAYLDELLKVPYATDPKYKEKIMNTPEWRKYL